MKLALSFLVALAFLSSHSASAMFGSGNDTCATATQLGAGSYPGLQLSDVWYPVPFDPNGAYATDFDWYRFTLMPGESLTVGVGVTAATGSSASSYIVFRDLREYSSTTCAGVSIPGATFVQNTTPAPKDYVFLAYAFGLVNESDVYLTYTLDVQISTAVTGVAYCPGAPNSVGGGGTLAVSGTNSVSANNLIFNAASLPANGFALLVDGTGQSNVPFGDGTLCVTGSLQRLYVVPVSGSGTCGVALDIPNLPPSAAIVAGNLRYFQLYYRDSAGPLGTGFNLTNAMAVPFTP